MINDIRGCKCSWHFHCKTLFTSCLAVVASLLGTDLTALGLYSQDLGPVFPNRPSRLVGKEVNICPWRYIKCSLQFRDFLELRSKWERNRLIVSIE